MATREEVLKLSLAIAGADDANKLRSAVAALDKEFENAGPEAKKLVDELKALGESASQTRQLQGAVDRLKQLAEQEREVSSAVDKAGLSLKLSTLQEQAAADVLAAKTATLNEAKQAQAEYAKQSDRLVLVERELAAAVKDAAADQKAANAEWKASATRLSASEKAFEKVADSQAKISRESDQLRASLKASGVSAHNLSEAEKELATRSQAIANETANASDKASELSKSQAALAEKSKQAAAGLSEVASQSQKGSAFTRAMGAAADAAGKGFTKLRAGVNDAASSLLRVTGIAGAVSAALGAITSARIFGNAVSSAREFGSALSEVQAVSGATAEEMKQLRAAAENATANTKFSATEAAKGLGELARASGSAKAAIAALPAILQLAQAAGLGVAESATIVTTTLTQFGLSVDYAGRVADVLAKAANSTTADVQGLGNALSYAAPLANQLGLNLEQTTAVIGALADQGFRGERAGTALRNVFSALLDPASNFKQALVGLGITSNDFTTIIEGLAKAGDRGREALLTLDAEARPAILSLVKSAGAGISQLKADLDGAAGSAANTAKVMGQNFESASARFANAFDSIRRALVDPILDAVTPKLDEIATKVRDFAKTADFDKIKAAITDFANQAVAAFTRLTSGFDPSALAAQITQFVKDTTTWFTSLKENAESVGKVLSAVGNTVSIFWNALQTGVFAIATAINYGFTKILEGSLAAAKGLAQLSGTAGGLKPVFDEMERQLGALKAVTEEFGNRTVKNAQEMADAWDGLTEAVSGGDAAEGIAETGDAADRASGQLDAASSAADSAASSFTRLADSSSSAALAAATEAYTTAAANLDRLRATGKATADEIDRAQTALFQAQRAMLAAGQSAQSTASQTDALKASFAGLGIESQKSLDQAAEAAKGLFETIEKSSAQTAQGLAERQRAFLAYAQAALAAAATADAGTRGQVEAQLEAKASALGVLDALEKLEGAAGAAGEAGEDAGVRMTRSFGEAAGAARGAAEAAGEAAGQFEQDNKRIQEMEQSISGTLGPALSAISAGMSEFGAHSAEAALRFNGLIKALFDGAGVFSAQAQADATGIIRLGEAIAQAAAQTRKELQAEQESAASLEQQFSGMSAEALRAMAQQAGGIGQLAKNLEAQAAAMREGSSQFKLLGAQDLSGLTAALEGAAQRARALAEAARDAKASFADLASDLAAQIAEQEGNSKKAEELRFKKQLENLRKQAEETGTLQSREYAEAVANATKLHKLKLKQIAEEAAAKKKADDGDHPAAGGGGGGGPPPAPAPSGPSRGTPFTSPGGAAAPININVQVQGSVIGAEPGKLGEELARVVDEPLQRIARRRL